MVGIARQDERDVRADLEEPAHESLAGDAQAAADVGRELPAEHEDAHRSSPSPSDPDRV